MSRWPTPNFSGSISNPRPNRGAISAPPTKDGDRRYVSPCRLELRAETLLIFRDACDPSGQCNRGAPRTCRLKTRRSKSSCAEEGIAEYLAHLKEVDVSQERLSNPAKTYPADPV